ncbi:hypothetical protein J6590_068614 [Homalodisca vitripennis]|nr:hypothetical protein J6590_068614 [Homalodisca vitripennis]
MAGQAGCLQGQDRSAVSHPSSRSLIWLSCDDRCTRYAAPLAISSAKCPGDTRDIGQTGQTGFWIHLLSGSSGWNSVIRKRPISGSPAYAWSKV